MSNLPTLSEANVRAITDSGSFSRGRDYFEDGQIINLRRQGMKLQAEAMGTALYRTEVVLNEQGIASTRCSCPVGSNCKHVVALLLTYIHQPESFKEVSETRKVLEQRNQAQLIDLILSMIERYPDLETMVDLPVVSEARHQPRIDPQTLLRQIRGGGRRGRGRYDYDDYYGGSYEQTEPVIDTADQFALAKDWGNAILAYATVIDELTENYEEYADHEGGLGDTLGRCATGLENCLDGASEEEDRLAALQALFDLYLWDVEQGGIGEGDEADEIILAAATPEEKQTIVQWVNKALPKFGSHVSDWGRQTLGQLLLALQMDELDDEGFLKICRQTGRYVELIDRLLKLQRIQEATASATALTPYELLSVEQVFATHQQTLLYETIVHASWQQSKDSRLAEWIKKRAQSQHNTAKALQFAEILFNEHPSLELYREMKRMVDGKEWQSLRTKLRAVVHEKKASDLLVRIQLEDEEFEQAIQAITKPRTDQSRWFGFGADLKVEVASAVEITHPQQAIEIFAQLAQSQIAQRNRQNYATAATYLQRVKRIYQRIGDNPGWQQSIQLIRTQHKNLPALQDELRRAGL